MSAAGMHPDGSHAGDLAGEAGWADRLRRACLYLFAALPLALLFSRTAAELIVAFIGLSFLAVIFARRRWDVLAMPLLAVPIAIWIFLMVVNTTFAWGEIPRVLGRTVPWLRFFCLFGAAVFWLFADERDFRKVVLAWGATLAFVVVDGLVQGATGTSLSGRELFGQVRLSGPLDRPNIGRFVALLFFPGLAAFLLFGERLLDRRRIAALAAAVAVAVFFVVFSGERSATLLSLATFTLAALVLMALAPRLRLPGAVTIVITLAITAATIMTSARLYERIQPTMGVAGDFWNSEYGKLIHAAVTVWQVQPVTGVGLGNFDRVCEVVEPGLVHGCLRHPHNIYLEWLAEAGVIGLAAFLAFAGAVIAFVLGTLRLRRQRPALVSLVLACPILTLFPLVPSQSFFSNWPAMLWWTSLAMTCAVAFHALHRKDG